MPCISIPTVVTPMQARSNHSLNAPPCASPPQVFYPLFKSRFSRRRSARKRKDLSFFTQSKPFYPFGWPALPPHCSSICSNFYDSSTKAPWLIEHNSSDMRKRLRSIGLFKLSWVTAAPGCPPPPPSSQYRSSKNPREGHFLSPDPQPSDL